MYGVANARTQNMERNTKSNKTMPVEHEFVSLGVYFLNNVFE